MTTHVTLTVPDELYRRAERMARLKDQDVRDLLTEVLTKSILQDQALERDGLIYDPDEVVEREKAAYIAMHPMLWREHAGEHVAIHGGKLIDHDVDGVALSQRIYEKYPNEFVLIRQVESEPDRVLKFRSPRFVEET